MKNEFISHNLEEMADFARVVLSSLVSIAPVTSTGATTLARPLGATVLALYGDLGSGKTAFVKKIAELLGVTEEVTSPTFVIEKIYDLPPQNSGLSLFTKLIHIDAYRLQNGAELEKLGWRDILTEDKTLICLEWPERVADIIPETAQKIYFTFIDEKTRAMTIEKSLDTNHVKN